MADVNIVPAADVANVISLQNIESVSGGSFIQMIGGAEMSLKTIVMGAAIALFTWYAMAYRYQARLANQSLNDAGLMTVPMPTVYQTYLIMTYDNDITSYIAAKNNSAPQ
jgi:hypothetical protein